MEIIVKPSGQSCGASVTGVDLTNELSTEVVTQIRAAWLEHKVLSFPGQHMSDDDLERFTLYFGDFGDDPFIAPIPGRKNIIAVQRKADETTKLFAENWHTDWSFQERPPAGTCLFGINIPPSGGDTLFANQVQAYESLSDGLKDTLATLNIICRPDKAVAMATRADRIAEKGRDTSEDSLIGIHPVIRTHPETGKKALYINQAHSCHFQGWSIAESDGLLTFLYAHQIREEFQCRHVWRKGDVAIWDNRCTLHYPVNDYHGHRRLLHRITLKGDKPV